MLWRPGLRPRWGGAVVHRHLPLGQTCFSSICWWLRAGRVPWHCPLLKGLQHYPRAHPSPARAHFQSSLHGVNNIGLVPVSIQPVSKGPPQLQTSPLGLATVYCRCLIGKLLQPALFPSLPHGPDTIALCLLMSISESNSTACPALCLSSNSSSDHAPQTLVLILDFSALCFFFYRHFLSSTHGACTSSAHPPAGALNVACSYRLLDLICAFPRSLVTLTFSKKESKLGLYGLFLASQHWF